MVVVVACLCPPSPASTLVFVFFFCQGLPAREAEEILYQYPDSDTCSENFEVVDGQSAKVTYRYAIKVLPTASELEACIGYERWRKMLRKYAKNEGDGGKVRVVACVLVHVHGLSHTADA